MQYMRNDISSTPNCTFYFLDFVYDEAFYVTCPRLLFKICLDIIVVVCESGGTAWIKPKN